MKSRQGLFWCKCRAQGWAPNMGLTSPAGQKLPHNCCPSGLSAGSSIWAQNQHVPSKPVWSAVHGQTGNLKLTMAKLRSGCSPLLSREAWVMDPALSLCISGQSR